MLEICNNVIGSLGYSLFDCLYRLTLLNAYGHDPNFGPTLPRKGSPDGQHVRFQVQLPVRQQHIALPVSCGGVSNGSHPVIADNSYRGEAQQDPPAEATTHSSPMHATAYLQIRLVEQVC